MDARLRVAQWGEFVPAPSGSRLRLVTEPEGRAVRGSIVFAHAFAEEMNKSRRTVALAARALAAAGWRVVQRDLRGCGDSAGEFADASWADWIDDIQAEARATDPALPCWLWGHRAGALLAAAALATRPDAQLLLWQPVLQGAQHLQQFLRLHAGARIVGSTKASDDTSPAALLKAGRSVELGGYELSPALANGLGAAAFEPPPSWQGRIVWLELSADAQASLSPAATRAIERLAARGLAVEAEALHGPAFWQTQEIEEGAALVARTVAALEPRDVGAADAH